MRGFAVAIVCATALAACGGGGGSSSTPSGSSGGTTGGTGPSSAAATISVAAAEAAAQSLPSIGGITGTLMLSNVSAPAGATLSVQSSTSATGSVPTLQGWLRSAASRAAQSFGVQTYVYVAITPSATVTAPNYPTFTFNFPASTFAAGTSLYVAYYDGQTWHVPALGPSTNGSFQGTSTSPALTFSANVTYVFAVYSYTTGTAPTPTPSVVVSPTPTPTPFLANDCHFGSAATCNGTVDATANQQWDMYQIGAPYAWHLLSAASLSTGGVKIAIIDTGWDCTHTGAADDLSANVVFEAAYYNGDGSLVGSDTAPFSGCYAEDTDGHGTNVSGIADAVTNNSVGFAGVGFNAKLYEYRIFPTGFDQSAQTPDEIAAIDDAVSRGVNVISMSLGGGSSDPNEQAAIQNAIANNVTIVAAAGNDGVAQIDYPAAYPGVISVGATSLADGSLNGRGNTNGANSAPVEYIASYSNWSSALSLVATGGDPSSGSDRDVRHWIMNLYSTGDTTAGDTCTPSSQPDHVCAALFAGTSQATPHVAGAAALLLAQNGALTPAQIAQTLESTADDICSLASYACPGGSVQEGHGRLNVYRALGGLLGLGALRGASSIGTIGGVPSTGQGPAPSAASNAVFRMPARRSAAPQTSSSLLYVHYRLSALRSAGRGVADVERATGIVRSTRLQQSSADDELHVVRIPAGESIDAVAAQLRAQAGVRSVEAVQLRHAL